jgi:predicted N-formylglutamate amidohydrolase
MTGSDAVGAQPRAVALVLAPDEPGPFEVVNPHGRSSSALVCDHASNQVPRVLAGLGLTTEQLDRHIAWDPGAAEVARGLADRLDAPLLLGGYSRLVIDLNRPLVSPESIPERSDGIAIPGNHGLGVVERRARVTALFDPYHQAITRLLDARRGTPTLLFSIHSFTPVLGDASRPWHAGVACGRDPRLARPMHLALARPGDLCIGYNQPYDVDDDHDFTLPTHGEGRDIPHVMIEMRQDGLRTAAGVDRWVDRLAEAILSVAPAVLAPGF